MSIQYLLFEDIVLINEMTVMQHGGNFVPPSNFLHEESLKYVIDTVEAEMFGEAIYPTIPDKAAVYMFSVISNHIFQDGNKRTGLEAALLFLRLNNRKLDPAILGSVEKTKDGREIHSSTILYNFTVEVASGLLSLEQVRDWFKEYVIAD